jgi:hypothetical protein
VFRPSDGVIIALALGWSTLKWIWLTGSYAVTLPASIK